MKKAVCYLLIIVLLFCSQLSVAFAKREVNSADYSNAAEFLDDIETGTVVSFDAVLFSTQPYVDEDSYCLCFVLLPWNGVKPCGGIYAREEDIGDLTVTKVDGIRQTKYVHVVGVADGVAKNGYFYVYIMDGKGNMEVFEPEFNTYCLDEQNDVQTLKENAVNYLDKMEIKNGTVIKTDDTQIQLNNYQVWISCGEYTIYVQTPEKQFFVDDHVMGIGLYNKFMDDGSIMLSNTELFLIK